MHKLHWVFVHWYHQTKCSRIWENISASSFTNIWNKAKYFRKFSKNCCRTIYLFESLSRYKNELLHDQNFYVNQTQGEQSIQGAIRAIIWSSSFFTQNSPCPHNLSFLAPHCMIFRRILYHHLGESKTKMNIFLDNWRKNFNSHLEKFGVYTMVQLLLQNILIWIAS